MTRTLRSSAALGQMAGLMGEELSSQIMGVTPRSSLLQDTSVKSVLSKTTFKQFGHAVIKMTSTVIAVSVPVKPSR